MVSQSEACKPNNPGHNFPGNAGNAVYRQRRTVISLIVAFPESMSTIRTSTRERRILRWLLAALFTTIVCILVSHLIRRPRPRSWNVDFSGTGGPINADPEPDAHASPAGVSGPTVSDDDPTNFQQKLANVMHAASTVAAAARHASTGEDDPIAAAADVVVQAMHTAERNASSAEDGFHAALEAAGQVASSSLESSGSADGGSDKRASVAVQDAVWRAATGSSDGEESRARAGSATAAVAQAAAIVKTAAFARNRGEPYVQGVPTALKSPCLIMILRDQP